MEIIVGIGDIAVSNRPVDVIKTYALASCVAVTMYLPAITAAGMIHIALPHMTEKVYNNDKPGYYATVGLPILLRKMETEFGCRKQDLVIRLYGGADSISANDCFLIGKRNLQAITDYLKEMNLHYTLSDVGGTISRTVELTVATGTISLITHPLRI